MGSKHSLACTKPEVENAHDKETGNTPAELQLPLVNARFKAVRRPSCARLHNLTAYMWAESRGWPDWARPQDLLAIAKARMSIGQARLGHSNSQVA